MLMLDLPGQPTLDKLGLIGTCSRLPLQVNAARLQAEVAALPEILLAGTGGRVGVHRPAQAIFLRRIRLTALVDRSFLVFTDADRDQPSDRVCRGRGAHAFSDLSENAITNRPAVQEPVVFHRRSAGAPAEGGFCFCRCHSSESSVFLPLDYEYALVAGRG
jgi:hypothetical protein